MTDAPNFMPSKEQYEILKDALGFGIEIIGLFFPKAAGALTARRVDNLITIMEIVKKKLNEADIKPEERKAIALKFSIPFIEDASLEEDPSLQELWANLLANALNPNTFEKAKPVFIGIIKNLSASEVLILNAFHCSRQPLLYKSKNIVSVKTPEGYKELSSEAVENSLAVLKSLNLVTDIAVSEDVLLGDTGIVCKDTEHLTPLGILFIDACIKDSADSPTEVPK